MNRSSVAPLWSRHDRLSPREVALLCQVGQRVLLLFYAAESQAWSSATCLARLPLHVDSLFFQPHHVRQNIRSPVHLISIENGAVMVTESTGMAVVVDNDAFLSRHPSFLPIDATHCFLHFLASAREIWSLFQVTHRDDPRAFFARLAHVFPSLKDDSSCASCQGAARCHAVAPPTMRKQWRAVMSAEATSGSRAENNTTNLDMDVSAWKALVEMLPEAVTERILAQWATVPMTDTFLSTCQQMLHEAVPFHRVSMKALRCGLLEWKTAAQRLHRRLWEVAPFGLWLALFQIDFGDPPEAQAELASLPGVWTSTIGAQTCGPRTCRFARFASPDDAALFFATHPALRAVP